MPAKKDTSETSEMKPKFKAEMFDFTDTSDLDDDLAKKLHSDALEKSRVYVDLVEAGAEAGLGEMNISQIMAVAKRAGLEEVAQGTVRTYLNKAYNAGLLTKPTRQTYAPAKRRTLAEDTGLDTSGDPLAVDEDPLADL